MALILLLAAPAPAALAARLVDDGHRVRLAPTLAAARTHLASGALDLVIAQARLADGHGLDLCRDLAQDGPGAPPLILLADATEAGDETAVVHALARGADDLLAAPLRLDEAAARIAALLRRSRWRAQAARPLVAGDLALHGDGACTVAGRAATLTPSEARILARLMRDPGAVCPRGELMALVRGDDGRTACARTVDVHIVNLRAKLRPLERCIATVRGIGYRLEADHALVTQDRPAEPLVA
jgi:two-component system catabolic regulation response regulator CreB